MPKSDKNMLKRAGRDLQNYASPLRKVGFVGVGAIQPTDFPTARTRGTYMPYGSLAFDNLAPQVAVVCSPARCLVELDFLTARTRCTYTSNGSLLRLLRRNPVAVALRFVAFVAWCPTACDVFCARL